ncbi:MAG: aldo/keto reductase [Clostridia bacterium]|nr:aldo/keto reductase [Clostridia bacterium]
MQINEKRTSPIALGTAAYGNGISERDAFLLINKYLDLGGNVLDTARVYGESEGTIGKYLSSHNNREKLIIATKGAHYDLVTKEKRVTAQAIAEDVETSLKNLKTDYVDIYWLHRDDEDIPAGEIVEMTAPLIKSGKALTLGVSNWRAERIAEANAYADAHNLPKFLASQIKHSAAVSVNETDPTILSLDNTSRPFYEKEKMPIFAFTSQAKGLFPKLERLGESGISEGLRREFFCEETLRRYREIKNLSLILERPVSQIALAMLMRDPRLEIIPIIGGKTTEQIADSMAALEIKLTELQYETVMKG